MATDMVVSEVSLFDITGVVDGKINWQNPWQIMLPLVFKKMVVDYMYNSALIFSVILSLKS